MDTALVDAMDRIAPFFDAEYAGYDDDLPALEAFAGRTGGPVLELGCGTGRGLIPLAQAGYAVTGVDISPAMLSLAQARAQAAGVADRVRLVEGEYAEAPLGGPYGFAFVVMNTFLHLATQAAQVRALKHWRQHLAPGGLLLIDIFHPDVVLLANLDGRVEWVTSWQEPATGNTVTKFMIRTVDYAEQTIHTILIYEEISQEGQVRRTVAPFDLRYLWRFEAGLLLEKAGFAVEALYGDWDMGPFESTSDHMIWVARRRS